MMSGLMLRTKTRRAEVAITHSNPADRFLADRDLAGRFLADRFLAKD
jgi:hypothetical protein